MTFLDFEPSAKNMAILGGISGLAATIIEPASSLEDQLILSTGFALSCAVSFGVATYVVGGPITSLCDYLADICDKKYNSK